LITFRRRRGYAAPLACIRRSSVPLNSNQSRAPQARTPERERSEAKDK